jgi:ABC-type multidrug transport system permease subunit
MPVHPASYALGIALAPLLVSIPSLIFFGGVTAYLGYFTLESLGWTVLALVLVWAATSSMGFMISTYLFKSSPMVLNNLANLLGIGFIFIPPVYFSEAQLGSLSWISIIVPTSNVAGLMRSYMGLLSMSAETVMIRWAVLILMSVAFIVLTSMKSRWRET